MSRRQEKIRNQLFSFVGFSEFSIDYKWTTAFYSPPAISGSESARAFLGASFVSAHGQVWLCSDFVGKLIRPTAWDLAGVAGKGRETKIDAAGAPDGTHTAPQRWHRPHGLLDSTSWPPELDRGTLERM